MLETNPNISVCKTNLNSYVCQLKARVPQIRLKIKMQIYTYKNCSENRMIKSNQLEKEVLEKCQAKNIFCNSINII